MRGVRAMSAADCSCGPYGIHRRGCPVGLNAVEFAPPTVDMVSHPPHYSANGIEAIDVIEAFELGHHIGDAVAYLLRADRKGDAIQDFKKAVFYINREIALRERKAAKGGEE